MNGRFWHKHEGCKYFVWPKNNADFWKNKIESNVTRDDKNYQQLKELGWKVLIIWECELKRSCQAERLERIVDLVRGGIV